MTLAGIVLAGVYLFKVKTGVTYYPNGITLESLLKREYIPEPVMWIP
jgi:hypothetical protein